MHFSTFCCFSLFFIAPIATQSVNSSNLTKEEWELLAKSSKISDELIEVLYIDTSTVMTSQKLQINSKKLKVLTLHLEPNMKIIDQHFLILMRKENETTFIKNNENVKCLYRSKFPVVGAFDICKGVRGAFRIDNSYYTIFPFIGNTKSAIIKHVIIKRVEEDRFEKINGKRVKRDVKYNDEWKCGNNYNERIGFGNETQKDREKRNGSPLEGSRLFVETAVFIDRDLYDHMRSNFETNTEEELIRFVLAMINAVELLYHDPSLGWIVNFVLKRLEILHSDPKGLYRSHDIDRFLNNFCTWQHGENPIGDDNPLHWDHAVIMTGLDLYVLSKNGKISSQVVGLAPVAGMCTATSSCTVNEGRHFDSAYVVAHEIGHNLGMRHDGPSANNECDPSSFIMSPTLGKGKITWSKCSNFYLEKFLQSKQSRCLMDQSATLKSLDHSSNGLLPGERFDSQHQCKLKYGSDSRHSVTQPLGEICKDLQCFKDGHTWTSHPALEGTRCGNEKWCRSGRCVEKGLSALEAGFVPHQMVHGGWSHWSPYSECASSCLHGSEGGLSAGSTGIMIASRRCNNPRPENGGFVCSGSDYKYKTCTAPQCDKVSKMTIKDFTDDICSRASEIDTELTGKGYQKTEDDTCTLRCEKKDGGHKSHGWSYPDGTVCKIPNSQKPTYCVKGSCKEFVCKDESNENSTFVQSSRLCVKLEKESSIGRWIAASECYYNCITPGIGLRLVERLDCKSCNVTTSIQSCYFPQNRCKSLDSVLDYATTVCSKFSQRVRRISGIGMQLSSTAEDPHRPCRLACQDESVNHRFYLVNGEDGWFPFGADCTRGEPGKKAFCINGKCLEFGSDDVPTRSARYMGRVKRHSPKDEQFLDFTNSMQEIVSHLKNSKK